MAFTACGGGIREQSLAWGPLACSVLRECPVWGPDAGQVMGVGKFKTFLPSLIQQDVLHCQREPGPVLLPEYSPDSRRKALAIREPLACASLPGYTWKSPGGFGKSPPLALSPHKLNHHLKGRRGEAVWMFLTAFLSTSAPVGPG